MQHALHNETDVIFALARAENNQMQDTITMNIPPTISELFQAFLTEYDSQAMDSTWLALSQQFKKFWDERILSEDSNPISESDCDEIVRILDRNGKGNTKNSEAVAKAMVPQGAWRRMFNEFHSNQELGALVYQILSEDQSDRKAALIDNLYTMNSGKRNNLTGPSGNTIGAFLAAYDPINNLSMISLNDRRSIIEYLGLPVAFDWDAASIGTRIIETNTIILDGIRAQGLEGTARTFTRFFYSPSIQALWKGRDTVKRTDKNVSVKVPSILEDEPDTTDDAVSVRESMQIQGLIAKIGTLMGCTIWLPRADRSRVLKVWHAKPGELLNELPLGYDTTTMKTIEQIDVLWLRNRSIVRAFEVEHTTSVYSGLLRMADLVALQPNINIKLHIVAPAEKREKVLQEIQRPVFSLLESRALAEMCTYLSYDNINEIGELKHLAHLSDKVIEEYEEIAE
jgi:hypothetical protein